MYLFLPHLGFGDCADASDATGETKQQHQLHYSHGFRQIQTNERAQNETAVYLCLVNVTGANCRNVNDFTSFNPLDNDKNGMTLQSKIFFLKRQMPHQNNLRPQKLFKIRLRP